jgi:ketosteroid isomerase-like protein
MKFLAALLLLPLALLASPSPAQLKQELIDVEHAFRDMVASKGAPAAFSHFAAPDVAFFRPDPREHRGPSAVVLRMKDWSPKASVSWEPLNVEASTDGSLGYTWGRYEYTEPDVDPAKPAVKSTGFYLTIWKRQPDGSWRFTMDTGTPDKTN